MTKQELWEILDSWENFAFTINEIGKNPECFKLLIEIALHNNDPKSWRAAYMVDKIHDDSPDLLLPFLEELILKLQTEKNSSKKRHFLKLISMNKIPQNHFSFLVDYCLNALSSAKEPPAVRVHAMQILFNISDKEPGLKPEILAVIEHEMEFHATPGIISRGSKLAKKLNGQIQNKPPK